MTDKHTQGPWTVKPEEVERDYTRIRGTVLGGRFKVANVISPAYEGVHPREAIETRANAFLIAAAPDLLDALRLVSKDYGDLLRSDYATSREPFPHRTDETLILARAAIAKATGGRT